MLIYLATTEFIDIPCFSITMIPSKRTHIFVRTVFNALASMKYNTEYKNAACRIKQNMPHSFTSATSCIAFIEPPTLTCDSALDNFRSIKGGL
jgi:hypothetical protein